LPIGTAGVVQHGAQSLVALLELGMGRGGSSHCRIAFASRLLQFPFGFALEGLMLGGGRRAFGSELRLIAKRLRQSSAFAAALVQLRLGGGQFASGRVALLLRLAQRRLRLLVGLAFERQLRLQLGYLSIANRQLLSQLWQLSNGHSRFGHDGMEARDERRISDRVG